MTSDLRGPEILIEVTVRAGARWQGIRRSADGTLLVAVHQAPERGKANRVVLALLSDALGLRRSQLEIASGETSPRKKIRITGLTEGEFNLRLSGLLGA